MISDEQCNRIERFLINTASAGRPATPLHIADQLHFVIPEVNSCLRELFKQGRVQRIERVGTAFYWVPKAGELEVKPEPRPAPDPVPMPAEYVDDDPQDLPDAPLPAAKPNVRPAANDEKALEERIVEMWNSGTHAQHLMAKELHIRVDRASNIVKRLIKQGRIHPLPRDPPKSEGTFRAKCGRLFTTAQGQHHHETTHKCGKVQEKKSEKVEQAPEPAKVIVDYPKEVVTSVCLTPEPPKPKAVFCIEPDVCSKLSIHETELQYWVEELFAHGVKKLTITKGAS